jgi:hypothetical protein
MADVASSASNGATQKRGVVFAPTVDLGQIGSAVVMLLAAGAAWASMDARVSQQEREIKRVEGQAHENDISLENRMVSRINDERARLDQTAVRTADDIREVKQLLRDGFKDLDAKLERKADKPGR